MNKTNEEENIITVSTILEMEEHRIGGGRLTNLQMTSSWYKDNPEDTKLDNKKPTGDHKIKAYIKMWMGSDPMRKGRTGHYKTL